jgi:hypothetical protein
MKVWNASTQKEFKCHPFLGLILADNLGMAAASGSVGHFGRCGCCHLCPMPGRHQEGGTHYYAARLLPDNFNVANSAHPDIDITEILDGFNFATAEQRYNDNLKLVMSSRTRAEYEERRLKTGIAKPSIFSGLPSNRRFAIPTCFGGDIMHLPCLNIPDLFLSLWLGKFKLPRNAVDNPTTWPWAVFKDTRLWVEFGEAVAACGSYLPGSFDRPPRNIEKKLNTQYKAWEFLLVFFMLGPALLHGILPEPYYGNYCKLVQAYRILMQDQLRPEEIEQADQLYTQFSDEFELIYIQQKADRLHMAHQSIHTGSHNATETMRIGPLMNTSQWTMERMIGLLVGTIRSHVRPYANLCEISLEHCRVNALTAIFPELVPKKSKERVKHSEAGNGYILLQPRDDIT